MGVTWNRPSAPVIRSPRWPALRLAAKRRDDWRCVQCGARGRLEVDHVKPVRTHPELAFDLEFAIALPDLSRPENHESKSASRRSIPRASAGATSSMERKPNA